MRSTRSYQREIQRLKRLLLAAQWVQPSYNGSPSCSLCGKQQHFGHADSCEYVTVLKQPKDPHGEGR